MIARPLAASWLSSPPLKIDRRQAGRPLSDNHAHNRSRQNQAMSLARTKPSAKPPSRAALHSPANGAARALLATFAKRRAMLSWFLRDLLDTNCANQKKLSTRGTRRHKNRAKRLGEEYHSTNKLGSTAQRFFLHTQRLSSCSRRCALDFPLG